MASETTITSAATSKGIGATPQRQVNSLPTRVELLLPAMPDPAMPPADPSLELITLEGSRLVIGRYPPFQYNARGGGGAATCSPADTARKQLLRFDASQLQIPALDWRSGRFLGLPLPPGVVVAIEPLRLAGELDRTVGSLQLRFQARFQLRLGPRYRAPDLWIDTHLTTGSVQGKRHRACGEALGSAGFGVLVGVAPVAPSGEAWLDRFLGLPDEALAVLRCRLCWS